MTQAIEIVISPNGESTVKTLGFRGESCRQASRFIEQALGQRADEKLTAEFYAGLHLGEQVRQHNGP